MNVIRLHDAQSGTADGYSVPGKLSEEFSIKTRTEGYFFRQSVNQYRVPRSQGQTSRDIVQAVESELYLFDRLVDTVSDKALQTEMRLNDGEKLRILLLSVDDSTIGSISSSTLVTPILNVREPVDCFVMFCVRGEL